MLSVLSNPVSIMMLNSTDHNSQLNGEYAPNLQSTMVFGEDVNNSPEQNLRIIYQDNRKTHTSFIHIYLYPIRHHTTNCQIAQMQITCPAIILLIATVILASNSKGTSPP